MVIQHVVDIGYKTRKVFHPSSRKVWATCLKAPENKLLTSSHPHLYACGGYGKGSRTKVTAENRLSLEKQEVFWQLLYTPEVLC